MEDRKILDSHSVREEAVVRLEEQNATRTSSSPSEVGLHRACSSGLPHSDIPGVRQPVVVVEEEVEVAGRSIAVFFTNYRGRRWREGETQKKWSHGIDRSSFKWLSAASAWPRATHDARRKSGAGNVPFFPSRKSTSGQACTDIWLLVPSYQGGSLDGAGAEQGGRRGGRVLDLLNAKWPKGCMCAGNGSEPLSECKTQTLRG